METIDAGEIVGQGEVVFHTTVHGPVHRLRTVGGTRVAISQQRSSYGATPVEPAVQGRDRGQDQRAQVVLQGRGAVAVHVQRRLRGQQAHRDLLGRPAAAAQPARGSAPADEGHGRVRVDGLPVRQRATPIRPTRRRASSSTGTTSRRRTGARPTTTGPTARSTASQMLVDGLAKRKKHTLASVTAAMNAAATQDLRRRWS